MNPAESPFSTLIIEMPFLPLIRAFSNLAGLHQIHINLTKA